MKKSTSIISFAGLLVVAVLLGVYLVANNEENGIERLSDQRRALQTAERFEPNEKECAISRTQAVHESSGAEYTFDTSCLPDGWSVNQTNEPIVNSNEPTSNDDARAVSSPPNVPTNNDQPTTIEPSAPTEPASTMSQEEALQQAKNYKPEGMCTMVMTPARHIESGATYTFTSGCIPDGWERMNSGV